MTATLYTELGGAIKRIYYHGNYIYLFIYIIYTEIPVQHSWFKWRSVQNYM